MNPVQAVASAFRRSFDFTGRAMRSEFWWFVVFYVVASAALFTVTYPRYEGPLMVLYALFILVTVLAYLAVGTRRLHDRSLTGWWLLLSLVPFGILVLIYWWAQPGDPQPNRYGPPPTAA